MELAFTGKILTNQDTPEQLTRYVYGVMWYMAERFKHPFLDDGRYKLMAVFGYGAD